MKLASSGCMKLLAVAALLVSSLLFGRLAYEERMFWPRASWTRTIAQPEYVHERYQRSYFSGADARALRRLHAEQAFALVGIVASVVALAYTTNHRRQRV